MTDIRIERRESRFPWWAVALAVVALLILLGLLWYFLAEQRAELAEADRTTAEEQQLNLDQVIADTGLPRQFTYGGMTWRAADVGRYERDGRDLIAVGPRIQGEELYYEQGTPTNPYQNLYMEADDDRYEDVFVRYEPANQ